MQSDSSADEVDFERVLAKLWAEKWLIITTTVLGSVVAIAYALLATPQYRAEALVQVRQPTHSAGGLNSFAASLGGLGELAALASSSSERALTIATLKSRVVIQSFISEKSLMPVLFSRQWDSDTARWKDDDPARQPTLWDGYHFFTTNVLKVIDDKKTGLVTIAVEWRDPEVAAGWVADLIARTNAYLRERTIVESEKNLEFLRQQVKQTGFVEVQQSVYALLEAELKKLMLAKGGEEFAIRTIDPAQAVKSRIKPKRRQIAMLGFLIGGMLGVALALLRGSRRAAP